jgi:hypothetical protein
MGRFDRFRDNCPHARLIFNGYAHEQFVEPFHAIGSDPISEGLGELAAVFVAPTIAHRSITQTANLFEICRSRWRSSCERYRMPHR